MDAFPNSSVKNLQLLKNDMSDLQSMKEQNSSLIQRDPSKITQPSQMLKEASILIDEDEEQDKSAHFKDAAIMRFLDGSVKVTNETEFINEFRRRANDQFWKQLDSIQTCVKSKIGIGRHIFIPFKVQIHKNDTLDQDIVYSYQKFGKEYEKEVKEIADRELRHMPTSEYHREIEERLRVRAPLDYCQRQCLKMCYYVQKIYHFEILHMDCDFYQDDNGKIWFFFVKNLVVRPQSKAFNFLS